LANEVETLPLLKECLRQAKRLAVPYLDSKKNQIWAIETRSLKDLRPGAYGVLEPHFDKNQRVPACELDLVIVPGLGFDRTGGRLGRGKGHFDRFLQDVVKAYKIGLAFKCQLLKEIPCDENDIKMDEVLTE
jgi:5-formyltetrahydrofolate cyclo-ligase